MKSYNILQNKSYLYLTEFFAEMSVMAVELLDMRVIDDLISSELDYYKNIFKTQGIKGLLNSGF